MITNIGERKMTTCYECGEDVIYPNDAFDVISKCSNKDCKTNHKKKSKKKKTAYQQQLESDSFFLEEQRMLLDNLMNDERQI
jgi:hypothetical protein